MLQYVAACCRVLPCVAVCCSVLQCVAVSSLFICLLSAGPRAQVLCSVLQCVAVCCSMLQRVAACCHVLPCIAVRCRVSDFLLRTLIILVSEMVSFVLIGLITTDLMYVMSA